MTLLGMAHVINIKFHPSSIRACSGQPGPWANQPVPRASQPGAKASQSGPRISQEGPRANQPDQRASQPDPRASHPGHFSTNMRDLNYKFNFRPV